MILTAVVIDEGSTTVGGTQDARLIVSVRNPEGKVISGLDESAFSVRDVTPGVGSDDFQVLFAGEMLQPPALDSPGVYAFLLRPSGGARWARRVYAWSVHLTPGFVGDREGHTVAVWDMRPAEP